MTVDFSKDVMLGMLRRGNTGNDILNILDVITEQPEGAVEQNSEEVAI